MATVPITRTAKEKESFLAGLNAGRKTSAFQAAGKAYNNGLINGNKGIKPKPMQSKPKPNTTRKTKSK